MSTVSKLAIKSTSSNKTEEIAEAIGHNLRGGEVIELISDLGGGKTVFTRGLVKGSGSTALVNSPTFTISKVYGSPNFDIHHFDFYRLEDAGIIEQELSEVMNDKKTVVVIEWADIIKDVLPILRLRVEIKNKGDQERIISLQYPKALEYLMKDLR